MTTLRDGTQKCPSDHAPLHFLTNAGNARFGACFQAQCPSCGRAYLVRLR